jgi:hypothetical protein
MQYVGSFGLWDEDYEKQKVQERCRPNEVIEKRKKIIRVSPASTSKAGICWMYKKKVENLKVSSFSPDMGIILGDQRKYSSVPDHWYTNIMCKK